MAFFLDNLLWFATIPVAFALVFVIKKYWISYPDDNKIEQSVEAVIKDKTGIDVDLSPESPPTKPV